MFKIFKIIIFIPLCILVLLCIIYASPFVHPISTLMIYDFLHGRQVQRQWVQFENIPDPIWHAVLASEDARFCHHNGIDGKQFEKVWQRAWSGKKTRGASTIPMQNAKNLFLWHGRSYIRKALELPIALFTDFLWSKQRSMEIYLNIAEWGENVYGISAAAEFHFDKDITKLSKRQISLLAVSLPNPRSRQPARPSANLTKLAKTLEHRIRYSSEHNFCIQK